MSRPRKTRRVEHQPPVALFKPQGIPLYALTGVALAPDGLEAMRLVDAEGLSQEEAARRMEVSRPTLCRILGQARSVVARALSSGWAIRLEAGDGTDGGTGGGTGAGTGAVAGPSAMGPCRSGKACGAGRGGPCRS